MNRVRRKKVLIVLCLLSFLLVIVFGTKYNKNVNIKRNIQYEEEEFMQISEDIEDSNSELYNEEDKPPKIERDANDFSSEWDNNKRQEIEEKEEKDEKQNSELKDIYELPEF